MMDDKYRRILDTSSSTTLHAFVIWFNALIVLWEDLDVDEFEKLLYRSHVEFTDAYHRALDREAA